MKVRFLADADLNKAIVSGVLRREPSIGFLTAQAAGLRRMKDAEVLTLAADRRRVLVSHDVGTTPTRFREFKKSGNVSAGVFLLAQALDIGRVIEQLLLISIASDASEWKPIGVAALVTGYMGSAASSRQHGVVDFPAPVHPALIHVTPTSPNEPSLRRHQARPMLMLDTIVAVRIREVLGRSHRAASIFSALMDRVMAYMAENHTVVRSRKKCMLRVVEIPRLFRNHVVCMFFDIVEAIPTMGAAATLPHPGLRF
ncbi:MAG TPA: DUF5615 family PIN-like protein [Bryobacteraceae bacterium]|nr:DUF5615 family PIN-like protein [Bryobacteraceae bacterium]